MNHRTITYISLKQYNLSMDKPLRITAYCRVSSLKEAQELSLETQIRYYTDKIEACTFGENAGVFSDTGTGRNIRQRPAFKKLMTKCRVGKVDLILTKFISRFGRNSLETIQQLRELRSLNIDVYFEQENIHLLDPAAQHIIEIYCALAQNESENKSHNIRWGIHEGFRAGTSGYQNFPCYGYCYDKEKQMLKIVSKEARVIRMIFDLRLQGYSLGKISSELAKRAILSPNGNPIWSRECIRKMHPQNASAKCFAMKNTPAQLCYKRPMWRIFLQGNRGTIPDSANDISTRTTISRLLDGMFLLR